MPAVRVFALYAGVSIVINFLLQIFAFTALLTLDARREVVSYEFCASFPIFCHLAIRDCVFLCRRANGTCFAASRISRQTQPTTHPIPLPKPRTHVRTNSPIIYQWFVFSNCISVLFILQRQMPLSNNRQARINRLMIIIYLLSSSMQMTLWPQGLPGCIKWFLAVFHPSFFQNLSALFLSSFSSCGCASA